MVYRLNRCIQLVHANRLSDKCVHSGFQAATLVFVGRVSCESDNANVLSCGRFQLANRAGGFQAIHVRHFFVHEHNIEVTAPKFRERFQSISRAGNRVAAFFQKFDNKLAIYFGVFGDEDTQEFRRLVSGRALRSGIAWKIFGRGSCGV